jgi:hypothetical protein
MQLPLTLAGGLRIADVVSSPLPGRLAALMSRLQVDRNERSGEERKWGNRNRNVARSRAVIGVRKHEPIHLEGRESPHVVVEPTDLPSDEAGLCCEEKVPMAADNAYRAKAWECLSLAECLNDPEERAEIVRFAWMWMSLAEPIEETRERARPPLARPHANQKSKQQAELTTRENT